MEGDPVADEAEVERQMQAAQAETDELVAMLRRRCVALHAALLRTASELDEARKQLHEHEPRE